VCVCACVCVSSHCACVSLCRPCKSRFVSCVSASDAESAVRARGRVRGSVPAPSTPSARLPGSHRGPSPRPRPCATRVRRPRARRPVASPAAGSSGPRSRARWAWSAPATGPRPAPPRGNRRAAVGCRRRSWPWTGGTEACPVGGPRAGCRGAWAGWPSVGTRGGRAGAWRRRGSERVGGRGWARELRLRLRRGSGARGRMPRCGASRRSSARTCSVAPSCRARAAASAARAPPPWPWRVCTRSGPPGVCSCIPAPPRRPRKRLVSWSISGRETPARTTS
jgi:hypothetical protein